MNGSKTKNAIETRYGGYRFRSRLEARWAVFLDACGEEWEYEKEGHDLPGGRYLPDFWLPRLDCWMEIKGEQPINAELKLCEELANATGKPTIIAWGLPLAVENDNDAGRLSVYCCDDFDGGGGLGWWDESFWAVGYDGKLCVCSGNWRPNRTFMTLDYDLFRGMRLAQDVRSAIPKAWANAAKSARFEFDR